MHGDSPLPLQPEPIDPDGLDPVSSVQRLPLDLSNWQVWEVEPTENAASRIPDLPDSLLVATLPERCWQVEPGQSVALPLSVLNNSGHLLTVRAHLEGWLDESWAAEPYVQANLAAGERRTLELTVAPPRNARAEAGDHDLAVVVRSLQDPARLTRLGVLLRILPFEQIQLDVEKRSPLRVTWWRRTLSLPLRMTNLGNAPIQVAVQGRAGTDTLVFRPGLADVPCTVQPGQQVRTVMALTARRLPILGARPCSFGLRAVDQEGRVLQQLRQTVELRPLLDTWQLAVAGTLALAGAGAALLLLLLAALLLQISVQTPSVTAPASPAAPAPAVIVVTLDQPATSPPPVRQPDRLSSTEPDPALPLVLPDQVSVPANGGAVRSNTDSASPQRPPSPAGTELTYAQLFQQVGAEYDLDWRMLAAQAYVESSFDTLALSSAGAMGLMQVLPATWREWAPAVSASDPFDSLSNLQVAAVYLNFLRGQLAQRGYAEVAWTLVAYHWGIDRLLDFLNSGGTWQDLPEPRRRYAEEILRIAQTLP